MHDAIHIEPTKAKKARLVNRWGCSVVYALPKFNPPSRFNAHRHPEKHALMTGKALEIENYLNYADERRVTLSVLELFGAGEEPYEVYYATVPGDTLLGRDDIAKSFLEHLHGKDGYAIDQRLSIYECGASGMLQDISVEVIGGVATPFVLYALYRLRTWISSSRNPQVPSSIEDCLRSLSDLIQRTYRSSGQVELTSHEATADSVSAVFSDERGTTYSCRIERLTGISSIKTRRDKDKPGAAGEALRGKRGQGKRGQATKKK